MPRPYRGLAAYLSPLALLGTAQLFLTHPGMAAAPQAAPPCLARPMPNDLVFPLPYAVSFSLHEAELSPEARRTLDGFKQAVSESRITYAGIEVHAGTAETRPADRDLFARRAEAVRAYIAGGLLPYNRIFYRLAGKDSWLSPGLSAAAGGRGYTEIKIIGRMSDPEILDRQLLCRSWLLANCIGTTGRAPAAQCKSGIDFLIRGDNTASDLDWRAKFAR